MYASIMYRILQQYDALLQWQVSQVWRDRSITLVSDDWSYSIRYYTILSSSRLQRVRFVGGRFLCAQKSYWSAAGSVFSFRPGHLCQLHLVLVRVGPLVSQFHSTKLLSDMIRITKTKPRATDATCKLQSPCNLLNKILICQLSTVYLQMTYFIEISNRK